MAELQSTDDTRPVEDVASVFDVAAHALTTVKEESENPGGWTDWNQPVGPKQPRSKDNPNLRGDH